MSNEQQFDCSMCEKLSLCPKGKAGKKWSYCGACGMQPIIIQEEVAT